MALRTTHAEEVALAARIAKGDRAARDELILRNLGLVHSTARSFSPPPGAFDDYVQTGMLGLIEATTRYDSGRGTRFGTYAALYIRKAILSGCVYRSNLIDTPYRHTQLHAPPQAGEVFSIEQPVDERGTRLKDRLPDAHAHDSLVRGAATIDVQRLIEKAKLSPREARIIRGRFWNGQTLAEIGLTLGIGRERVRQVEARTLRKLLAANAGVSKKKTATTSRGALCPSHEGPWGVPRRGLYFARQSQWQRMLPLCASVMRSVCGTLTLAPPPPFPIVRVEREVGRDGHGREYVAT